MKNSITVEVASSTWISYSSLQEYIELVPDEYKQSIQIEAQMVYHPYETEPDSVVNITYTRPETAEEEQARLKIDEDRQKSRERNERQLLAELTKKYSSNS